MLSVGWRIAPTRRGGLATNKDVDPAPFLPPSRRDVSRFRNVADGIRGEFRSRKIGVIPLLHENLIGLSPGARRRINKSNGIR